MNILPYILISLLGGAIVPLQLAIVNAFQKTTQASQILRYSPMSRPKYHKIKIELG